MPRLIHDIKPAPLRWLLTIGIFSPFTFILTGLVTIVCCIVSFSLRPIKYWFLWWLIDYTWNVLRGVNAPQKYVEKMWA